MVSSISKTESTASLAAAVERDNDPAATATPASPVAADATAATAELTGYGTMFAADTSLALLGTQEDPGTGDTLDTLLSGMDTNGDGVLDARDVAKNYLLSEQEAATKRQERLALDSGMAHASTRHIDTNNDGVISAEEKKAVYG